MLFQMHLKFKPSYRKISGSFIISTLALLNLQAFSQGSRVAIHYKLEYLVNRIHVDMVYQPLEPDSARFSYGVPAFGGQKDIFKGLQNLEAEGPVKLAIDSAERTIVFKYEQRNPIHISYDVADTRTEDNTRNQLFRPIIMADYFYIHGINLFLTPNFKTPESNYRISVEWEKAPPFKVFYTFDPESDGMRPVITTWDSIAFRFITGASDLVIRKFSAESGDNYLVLRSTGISPTLEKEVKTFYLNYNASMREFWKDKRIIKYSLVLQPFMNVDHAMSGVSFGNGFIGKYNKPDSIAKGERRAVIAHEIGHYYMSDLDADTGEKSEGQWFNEGFNDYLTYFNLVRANMMTADEFEKGFNHFFKSLYNSSIRNTPNDKIFENFWKLGDYSKLPYWRGEIFAFYLDNQISIATKNKNTLRDLMLDLKEIVKDRAKKMFTNEEFILAVSKYLPGDSFKKSFDTYILKGNPIEFSNQMLLPIYQIKYKTQTPELRIVDTVEFLAHFQHK